MLLMLNCKATLKRDRCIDAPSEYTSVPRLLSGTCASRPSNSYCYSMYIDILDILRRGVETRLRRAALLIPKSARCAVN